MPDSNQKNDQSGRFAYDGLDRVIHEKARLSVLTSLIAHPKGVVFGELKQMCALTDGNLSRHLAVLEEAKLIEIERATSTTARRPPAGSLRSAGSVISNISRCWSRWFAMRRAQPKAPARRIWLRSASAS